jgi:DNA transposition AAA+ family ATPase
MTAIAHPRPVDRFVETTAAKVVLAAITMAQRLVAPVRITGMPGTGKSAALVNYAPRFEAVYCECTGFYKNIPGLLRMLVAAYGIQTDAHHARDLADILFARLYRAEGARPNVPLLVDEWQNLEPPSQRELLRIAESCAVPLILCGNAERLFSGRMHKAALLQIDSRIGAKFETHGLTAEDCDSISIDFNVEGKEARELVKRFGMAVEFRRLADLLREATRATGGRGSIQLRHLQIAMASLSGWDRLGKAGEK